jgi:hypothetical protein
VCHTGNANSEDGMVNVAGRMFGYVYRNASIKYKKPKITTQILRVGTLS